MHASRYIKVIVLWTATTERFSSVEPGLNDTADTLLASIKVSTLNYIGFLQTILRDYNVVLHTLVVSGIIYGNQ